MYVSDYPVINNYLTNVIKSSIFSNNIDDMPEGGEGMRTDLDYYDNMVVFGKHFCVISLSKRYAKENVFTPDLSALHRVSIVDTAR